MHEHGLTDRLLAAARAAAEREGGRLVSLRARVGALGGSPERLRADLEHLRAHHGLDVAFEIEHAPDFPAGVELISVQVAR